jgi:DNA-directed RNA polymerase specialized sigma subunit
MRQIALGFEAGTPRYKIAAQYGISVSSVSRLQRKWRDNLA